MSEQQGSQKQLEMARVQIQQLSQQLAAERETAQRIQFQQQGQIDRQQQRLTQLEAQEARYLRLFDSLNRFLDRIVAERAALAATEARLNLLLNASPATTYSCQPDGDFACNFISNNVETLLGYTPAEFYSKPDFWIQQFHPDDAVRVLAALPSLFVADILKLEYRLRHRDGRDVWIHNEMQLLRDKAGMPLEVVGFIEDITERKQAEIALRESEQLYITLAQTVPVGLFRFNLEGNCIYVNQSWCKMTGRSPAFAQNNQWLATLHPDDVAYTQANVQQWLHSSAKTLFQNEARILREDGSIVWFYCQMGAETNANGETIGYVGTLTDITERKQAEIDLRDSQQLLQIVLDTAPIGIFWKNSDGVYQGINTAAAEILRLPDATTLIGRIDADLPWDVETLEVIRAEDRLVMATDVPRLDIIQSYTLDDNSEIWLETNKVSLKDTVGNPIGVLGTAQDVTQRQQTEKLLQQQLTQANLLRQITARIRQTLDLSTIFDTACNEVRQVLQAERVAIFQFYPESNFNGGEFIAESMVEDYVSVVAVPVRDHCFGENFANQYAHGRYHAVADIESGDLTACHQEFLRQLQVRANLAVPLVEGENALWGFLCVHQCSQPRRWYPPEIDLVQQLANQLAIAINQAKLFEGLQQELTERQLAERSLAERNEELSFSNQELARATRLKDEFLANMSHELRTPLNAILGMTECLQDGVFGIVNERQIKALGTIAGSGTHLLALINDILDVSKIAAGEVKLDYSTVAVEQLCTSSLAFIKQQALQKKIRLVTEIPPHLPALFVDEIRIRQVLLNLLTNAVKFTTEGGTVALKVSLLPQIPDSPTSNYLRIAITDTGIGIAPENISRLFKPFVQIDSALNRKQMGTGLGLALTKQIVELHGGQIGLTSELGVGSCFTVDLPYPPEIELPVRAEEIAPEVNLATPSGTAPTTKESPLVLLAEDNPANVATISSYLQAKGYRLIYANDGQTAIDLALSHQPDLILMDMQMPGMDGLEAIGQIRQQDNLSQTPIIVLTALAMKGDRERCLAAGANEYLSKPVKLKQLDASIQDILNLI